MRTAGPFTVESLSPHRTLAVDENDELIDQVADAEGRYGPETEQPASPPRSSKTSRPPASSRPTGRTGSRSPPSSPGRATSSAPKAATSRAAAKTTREAPPPRNAPPSSSAPNSAPSPVRIWSPPPARPATPGFDVLVACAFSYDAHSSDFDKLGRIPVLKARMNADLHMADDLKNTGKGNLFVIFGEPDIDILDAAAPKEAWKSASAERGGIHGSGAFCRRPKPGSGAKERLPSKAGLLRKLRLLPKAGGPERISPLLERAGEIGRCSEGSLDEQGEYIQVRINGVDVFHPNTGEVRSDGPDGIACWFIDTDYDEESFFVRHAYFLGANDPYKALRTTLKAEIDADAWATLHSDVSRPFPKPRSGRIAVKVINHLGDEVMKVFRI